MCASQVPPPTGSKTIGSFVVSPCGGTLEPGQSASIEVTFTPKGKGEYREFIQVRGPLKHEAPHRIKPVTVNEMGSHERLISLPINAALPV